jgi:thiol-disulfide isomerase/thioredoxin
MLMMIKKTIILIAVIFVASLDVAAQTNKPALSLTDIHGRKISLSYYKGKVVLINFWATWCPPCRTEIPDLVKLQRDYRTKGLRVIGITYPPQKLGEVRRFARRLRMNYPVALGTKQTKLLFTPSETLPITVVIGKDGSVRDIIEGILLPEEFEQRIKPLLLNGELK